MKEQEIVARLAGLRQEIEQDDDIRLETPFALALDDVCTALGLGDEERKQVLGPQGAAFVGRVQQTRVWAVAGASGTLNLAKAPGV